MLKLDMNKYQTFDRMFDKPNIWMQISTFEHLLSHPHPINMAVKTQNSSINWGISCTNLHIHNAKLSYLINWVGVTTFKHSSRKSKEYWNLKFIHAVVKTRETTLEWDLWLYTTNLLYH